MCVYVSTYIHMYILGSLNYLLVKLLESNKISIFFLQLLFIVISQKDKLLMKLCISIPTEWLVSKDDAIIVITVILFIG